MRRLLRLTGVLFGLVVPVVSCGSDRAVAASNRDLRPVAAGASVVLPPVRISEFHYDNASTDLGEAIEVSGPAGTDFTAYSIVLYNGSGGAVYDTDALPATATTCGTRAVVVLEYPSNGIQNGAPDGIALVGPGGTVVEFLSYEGTMTAVGGPASGMASTDVGVAELGSDLADPVTSLKRDAAGVWSGPSANNFGVCNDNDNAPPAGPVATVTVTPTTATIAQDGTQQFTASAQDADGNPVPTATFTWSSDAPAATVDASGLATGEAIGDATITATSANGVTGTATLHVVAAPTGAVYVSEIHYDNGNPSTDQGEAVEIEGPAGMSLAGWSLVLYNGNGGGTYGTASFTGSIPDVCDGRGVVVVNYPTNGLQNGSPDGLALVNDAGIVVEFLSYEGTFTAANGPASGMTSVDIGVAEAPDNSVPVGKSLQRAPDGTWFGPETSTFGACNVAPTVASIPLVIDELMADPVNAAGGASFGEWFEVVNTGTEPIDLQGWTITSNGQQDHTIASSVVVPAGGRAVLGRGADVARNGGLTIDYNYFNGNVSTTIFLDATDELSLLDPNGAIVDHVRWTSSSTMKPGVTRALRDPLADNENVDGSAWGYSTVTFGDGDYGTPHDPNGTLADVAPVVRTISFSGRLPSDPALPVGFEDQIFATLREGSASIPTSITWTAVTPDVATIDAEGVIHALSAGSATFRATADDGTTKTYTLPTIVATASTTAQYGNNTEFGDPTDATPADDYVIRRPQFTTSFNAARGTPNWVAYDLDATHFGSEDRCDCFTHDPLLPPSFTHLSTADYTGAGAAAGYGIDRGHLARSFDRTSASLDNAYTFLMSNIIPQAADLNQGPWANMENDLGDLARNDNREVYIVAGVAGNKGTLKDEGRVVVPTQVWKVALVLPRDHGLADVHSAADVQVIAVIMPNEPGVRNVDWHTYITTVNAVEALSGYDLLALLDDQTEGVVESGMQPVAALVGQLVASGTIDRGNGNSLSAKLLAAAAQIERGNVTPAVNQLQAFLHEVQAMSRSGRLPAADAAALESAVQGLIQSLSS